jgi:hypothetical protein
MEDIQRKLAKNVASPIMTKSAPQTQQWTLMLVGNDGRIVDLRMFRGWITISAFAVLLGAVAAFGFFFLYQKTADDNKRLQRSLDLTRKELKAARHEKDLLLARLVVSESNAKVNRKEKGSKIQIKDQKIVPQAPSLRAAQRETKQDVINKAKNDRVGFGKDLAKSTAAKQPHKPPGVGVEDLTVSFDTFSNSLKVQFVVRKTDPDIQNVRGRTFVILKPDESDDREWLALPPVDLAAGKPVQPQQGQFFGIAHFKPITLETKHLSVLNPYTYATVFIFSTSGDLVFEKTFEIEIQ